MRGEESQEGRPFREKESQEVRICLWQTGLGLGLLGDHRLAVRRALEYNGRTDLHGPGHKAGSRQLGWSFGLRGAFRRRGRGLLALGSWVDQERGQHTAVLTTTPAGYTPGKPPESHRKRGHRA